MTIVKDVANIEAKLEVTIIQLIAVRLWLNLKFNIFLEFDNIVCLQFNRKSTSLF